MFYIRFKKKIYWKNERIAHFRSFPLFWWVMWVNRSFRSNQMSDVRESLISLPKNERPWAIRSGRSEEMSNCERIAQVDHQKWANEWIAHFFERSAHSLIFGQKTSNSLGNQMSKVPALIILSSSTWHWCWLHKVVSNIIFSFYNICMLYWARI